MPSFDEGLFDQHVFGSLAFDAVFDSAIFDSELFDTSDTPTPPDSADVIRNFKIQKRRKERRFSVDNWQEWVREETPEVVEAVQAAVVAETKIAVGLNDEADIAADLERLELAKEAYSSAYREAFTKEFKRQWQEDMARYRFEIKRRAALLLLLS